MSRLSRRTLVLGGAALATVGLGAAGFALQPTVHRTPRRPLQALSPLSFSVFAALADVVDPPVQGFPSPWDLQVPEDADAFLATVHPGTLAELQLALRLLENGLVGLVVEGRRRTFTASDTAERAAILRRWGTSRLAPLKTAHSGLVKLAHGVYWGREEVWPLIGYAGPPEFPT